MRACARYTQDVLKDTLKDIAGDVGHGIKDVVWTRPVSFFKPEDPFALRRSKNIARSESSLRNMDRYADMSLGVSFASTDTHAEDATHDESDEDEDTIR